MNQKVLKEMVTWASFLGIVFFILAGIFSGMTENDQLIMWCFLLAVILIIGSAILAVRGGLEVPERQSSYVKRTAYMKAAVIALVPVVVILSSSYGINMEKYAPYMLIAGLVILVITFAYAKFKK